MFTPHDPGPSAETSTGSFKDIYPTRPGMWLDVTIGEALNMQGVENPDKPAFDIDTSKLNKPITQKKVQLAIAVSDTLFLSTRADTTLQSTFVDRRRQKAHDWPDHPVDWHGHSPHPRAIREGRCWRYQEAPGICSWQGDTE